MRCIEGIEIENLPFLLTDTVGFIRKLPHGLVESFKSTLDELREADLLVHVVDISHPNFEEQIKVVNNTLAEIKANDKPMLLLFNKIDAYTYIPQDEDDLTPKQKENWSLEDLKQTYLSNDNQDTVFISAKNKENIDELRQIIYDKVKTIHAIRYPYNNFLY